MSAANKAWICFDIVVMIHIVVIALSWERLVCLVVLDLTSLNDLIDDAELDDIHDDREDGHDEDDLDIWRKVGQHPLTYAYDDGSDARERKRKQDEQLHHHDRDEIWHQLPPPAAESADRA